jgi:hypothetical protein
MRGTPTEESAGRGLIMSLVFAGGVIVASYRPQIRLRTHLPPVRAAGMATADTAMATKQPSDTTEESGAAFALPFGY